MMDTDNPHTIITLAALEHTRPERIRALAALASTTAPGALHDRACAALWWEVHQAPTSVFGDDAKLGALEESERLRERWESRPRVRRRTRQEIAERQAAARRREELGQ